MLTCDFLHLLTFLYPQNDDLCLEIRPLLPEWRKAGMTEEEVRAVHSSVRRWYAIAPEYLCNAAKYAEGYADTFDVYFGVLPRVGRGGGQADVWGASCLFCDVDGGEDGVAGSVALVKASGLPLPHVAIVSGGGLHCYWLLSEPVVFESHAERETYKSVLRRLARKIGGASPNAHADTAACECARILRVPNTTNWKRENEPRRVKVVRNTDNERMEYPQWQNLLPAEPTHVRDKPRHDYTPGEIPPDGLLRWAKEGYPQGGRHNGLAGAAAWLLRDCHLSPDDATNLIRIKASHSPGIDSITDTEIEQIVRWAGR